MHFRQWDILRHFETIPSRTPFQELQKPLGVDRLVVLTKQRRRDASQTEARAQLHLGTKIPLAFGSLSQPPQRWPRCAKKLTLDSLSQDRWIHLWHECPLVRTGVIIPYKNLITS